MSERFWENLALSEMNREQWEALCDGCGRCCVVKVEDDGGEFQPTAAACKLLDLEACRCTDYAERTRWVPDCLELTPELAHTLEWLPPTCAYRRLARGQGLPEWHPLCTGDPDSVVKAGISMRGRLVSETLVHPDDLLRMRIRY